MLPVDENNTSHLIRYLPVDTQIIFVYLYSHTIHLRIIYTCFSAQYKRLQIHFLTKRQNIFLYLDSNNNNVEDAAIPPTSTDADQNKPHLLWKALIYTY